MRILIIEPEQAIIKELENVLQGAVGGAETMHCSDIRTARNWFRKNTAPHLVFSAITLSDGSSFDLFKSFPNNPPVVYMNTTDRFALEAFRQNGIYYLLKPLDKAEVMKAVSRYRYLHAPEAAPAADEKFQDRFLVTVGKQVKLVQAEEVAYFFSEQKLVYLITFSGNKYRTGFTLERLEQVLNPARFFRINRQFIIQLTAIVKMIPASKSRLQVILQPEINHDTITSSGRTDLFYNWLLGGFMP